MDIRYKEEYEFLDLSDLDESGREEVATALNSYTTADILQLPWDTGETDYSSESSEAVPTETHQQWQHYGMEEDSMKYDSRQDPSSSIVISTVPSQHIYPHQMMTAVYGSMVISQPSGYVNNPTANVHAAYMPGMAYTQAVYASGNEVPTFPSIRPTGRRNNRASGMKRDSYNRNNEAQTYITNQSQYQGVPRPMYQCQQMYYASDHTSPVQQPAPNMYIPPENIYPTTPMYSQMYPHSPNTPQFGRQLQAAQTYQIQEHNKDCAAESYDKRAQNVHTSTETSYRQHSTDEQKTAPQTNIVTTVIVNSNNVDAGSKDADECKNASSNSKVPPVNVKIEHNIVSTINDKKYQGSEKSEAPRVNINSSVEVKQERDEDEECESETVSHVKTTVVKTLSTPTAKQIGAQLTAQKASKNVQDVFPTEAVDEVSPAVGVSPTPPSSKSWASLLKKGPDETVSAPLSAKPTPLSANPTPLSAKPTARINPLNVNVPVAQDVQKLPAQTVNDSQQVVVAETKNHESEQMNEALPLQVESRHYIDPVDPVTYRMGEFFLQYQMDKQTVSLLPRGLTNRNNYCYINSILQALLACPPFYNLLMAIPDPRNPTKNSSTPLIDNMIKFAREFTPLSAGARLARKDLRAQRKSEDAVVDIQSGVAFEPSYVYTMLKNTSSAGVFSVEGRQEDAEEFLSCLLNGISDEMLEVMKLVSKDDSTAASIDVGVVNNSPGDHEEWTVMGPKNKGSITRCTEFGRTPLSDIFHGQLRSKITRTGSKQITHNVQPFFTLQLDIEKAESVEKALEILFAEDQLEGMTCSRTKQEIEAFKLVTLEELPVILILHLKWFVYNTDGCFKIVKRVAFPIDLKIESSFLSPTVSKKFSIKQRQYKLFAVTYHDGKEATKGHYVTDAFHVGYGGWVRYDDSSLKGISETNVLNPSPPRVPYLLYYRRCDTIGNIQPSNNNKTR